MGAVSENRNEPIVKFGKYWLCNRIGMGGMAEIYLARHQGFSGFDRTLAIKKIISHASQNIDFEDMFITEARIAARLQHSNIAHIYDFGIIDGSYFMAMEYIHGKNLMMILKTAQKMGVSFPIEDAVYIAMKVCDALSYAHTATENGQPLNIVHRDISPQNIVVSYAGDVKVLDFGIAKAASKLMRSLTTSGQVKGKYSYMSPEQAQGKPVDFRSDIFSIGIVLYEMISGRPLFKGNTNIDTMNQVQKAQVPLLTELGINVPDQLAAIVYKALKKEPQDRFSSAEEMARELSKFLYSNHSDYTPNKLGEFLKLLFKYDFENENQYLDKLPEVVGKAIEEYRKNGKGEAARLQTGSTPFERKTSSRVKSAKQGRTTNRLLTITLVVLLFLTIAEALLYFLVIKPDLDDVNKYLKEQKRTPRAINIPAPTQENVDKSPEPEQTAEAAEEELPKEE